MLIDWFTVFAQILNFLVLVWFLKRFLYKPILKAVDERERLIGIQISEAEQQNSEAEIQKTLFTEKNREFDQNRDERLRLVMEELEHEKETLTANAHKEYEDLRQMRQDALLAEESSLQQEIVQKTQDEVFAITRKVLEEMASSTLEEQMTAVFIRQLRALPPDEMERLVLSFRSSGKPVIIRSAYPLSSAQREEIQSVISAILGAEVSVQFETVSGLIGGIEMMIDGYKMAWSLSDIIDQAGRFAAKIIREKAKPFPQKRGNGDEKIQPASDN